MSEFESDTVRKFTLNGRTFTVVTRWFYDQDPDVSWLADPDNYKDCPPDKLAELMALDRKILAAFYRDEWWMMVCDVHVSIQDGPWNTESSEALWGIESNSDESYHRSVERNCLYEAFNHLRQGIDTYNRKGVPLDELIA